MNKVSEKIEEEVLIRLLIEHQQHSKDRLEFLRRHFADKGGHGVFAPIKGDRCGSVYRFGDYSPAGCTGTWRTSLSRWWYCWDFCCCPEDKRLCL
jgi:hypothetical protein